LCYVCLIARGCGDGQRYDVEALATGSALPPTFSVTKSALALRHRHVGRVTEASSAPAKLCRL